MRPIEKSRWIRTAPLTKWRAPWSVSVVSSSSVTDRSVLSAGLATFLRMNRKLLRNVLRALRRKESRKSRVNSAAVIGALLVVSELLELVVPVQSVVLEQALLLLLLLLPVVEASVLSQSTSWDRRSLRMPGRRLSDPWLRISRMTEVYAGGKCLADVIDVWWWSSLFALPNSISAMAAILVTVLPGVWTGVVMSRIWRKLRRMLSRNILAILSKFKETNQIEKFKFN